MWVMISLWGEGGVRAGNPPFDAVSPRRTLVSSDQSEMNKTRIGSQNTPLSCKHQCQTNKTLFDFMSARSDTIAMPETISLPLPAAHALRKLDRDLALARRKRGISTSDMAARLFVSRDTLWRLERGDPTVALGTLATVATLCGQLNGRLPLVVTMFLVGGSINM